ncbi:MAG: YceI family protein [Saprospiraceae bacterium]
MTQFKFLGLIAVIVLFSAFTVNNSMSLQIAEGYSIKFEGTKVTGIFKTMSGDIQFDENNLEASKFSTSIDVASINTGNGMKNKHAVSKKWFDAEKYPAITFNSSKFSKTDTGYEVIGELEIHGTKKEISIPFTFHDNTFHGAFNVNRLDYGIGTMKGMSKKVSNEIKLEISVPVTK